jgi:hypothetical protein
MIPHTQVPPIATSLSLLQRVHNFSLAPNPTPSLQYENLFITPLNGFTQMARLKQENPD